MILVDWRQPKNDQKSSILLLNVWTRNPSSRCWDVSAVDWWATPPQLTTKLFTLICVNGWWYSAPSDSFGGFHEMFSAGKPFRKFDLYMKQSENESLFHVFFPVFSHSLVRFSKKWRFGFELINQPSLLDWHKTGAAIITRNENDLDCRHQTLPGEILFLCGRHSFVLAALHLFTWTEMLILRIVTLFFVCVSRACRV